MIASRDETENDVRREDQIRINEFGKNNARLFEIREELKELRQKLEAYDDANTDLMMGEGDPVEILIGEAFVQVSEESAGEHLEALIEKVNKQVSVLADEESKLEGKQVILKKSLYGRFGSSINLEDK